MYKITPIPSTNHATTIRARRANVLSRRTEKRCTGSNCSHLLQRVRAGLLGRANGTVRAVDRISFDVRPGEIMALLGPGLLNVILALGLVLAVRDSRVIRGAVLAVKEDLFVEAARALGASHEAIILRHVLPNVFAPMIILATVNVGAVILIEAALSFLGFGVPPPRPSWGGMLSSAGLVHMLRAPWLALWPGVALSLAVFATNMLGDALRDVLDPRLRGT